MDAFGIDKTFENPMARSGRRTYDYQGKHSREDNLKNEGINILY